MSRATYRYVPVAESAIPSGVRFDVPRRNQGQTVEVSYGDFGRSEHDRGDLYMRIEDRSDRRVTYYQLVNTKTGKPAAEYVALSQIVE